ncbi:hypothetical protein BKI52_16115 [marine bacterium AO1-C]|nr:hypothetical protein BKI52_16115 [marine bacterium AO1-C]
MEEPLDDHLFEDYLKGRLQNYEEEPAADAWDNIFEAINQEDGIPMRKKSWFGNKWWMLAALLLWMVPGVIQDNMQKPLSGKVERAGVGQVQVNVDDSHSSEGVILTENKSEEKTNENKSRLPLVDKRYKKYTNNKTTRSNGVSDESNTRRMLSKSRLALQQPTNITNPMPKDNSPIRNKRRKTKVNKSTPKPSIQKTIINKVIYKNSPKADARKTHKVVSRINNASLGYMDYSFTSTKFVPVKETVLEPKKAKNLYIKLFVSPTYNYRRLLTNKEDNVIIQEIEKNGFFSGSNLGYSAGLMLESQLSKRWSLQWGVTFTQLNDRVNYRYRSVLPDSVTVDFISANEVKISPVFNTETSRFQYQYQDLGVQLGVNYTLFARSWKHQLYLGVAANQATKTISKTDETTITENTSRFQSLLNVGYEARFQLNHRLSFYLKPTLNYYLNSINQANEAYQVKPFFTALRLGLVWRLR